MELLSPARNVRCRSCPTLSLAGTAPEHERRKLYEPLPAVPRCRAPTEPKPAPGLPVIADAIYGEMPVTGGLQHGEVWIIVGSDWRSGIGAGLRVAGCGAGAAGRAAS